MAELTAASVGGRLEEIRSRIAEAGGAPEGVRIVAVTKGFGSDAVVAAAAAGCTEFGENYAAELLGKAAALADSAAKVHFLGGVQRNKVGRIAPHVHVWQSVDRLEVGERIVRQSPTARVLVQVDLLEGAITGRGGVPLREAGDLVRRFQDLGLTVEGLMAVGPPPPADPAPGFQAVASMAGRLGLREVSIGMSGDIEAAVRAGSTMIRIGRGLFGHRPKP